ncbi:MAG: hypothetical protein VXZ82_25625 [Planctomycetota bacterium]|nr:hypothetical protein [Planctomycetota bacterium]
MSDMVKKILQLRKGGRECYETVILSHADDLLWLLSAAYRDLVCRMFDNHMSEA